MFFCFPPLLSAMPLVYVWQQLASGKFICSTIAHHFSRTCLKAVYHCIYSCTCHAYKCVNWTRIQLRSVLFHHLTYVKCYIQTTKLWSYNLPKDTEFLFLFLILVEQILHLMYLHFMFSPVILFCVLPFNLSVMQGFKFHLVPAVFGF